MDTLQQLNATISTEAEKILYEYGLYEVLAGYGTPVPWGSFVLSLMTWRDLDIYLESNEMSEAKFFELGHELASILKPYSMHYRNEWIGRTEGNPEGLYWGIYTDSLGFPETWKIDLWAIDSNHLKRYQQEFDSLKTSIGAKERPAILKIKHQFYKHPEYRRGFASVDIYKAVIADDVKTAEEFTLWLLRNKKIS